MMTVLKKILCLLLSGIIIMSLPIEAIASQISDDNYVDNYVDDYEEIDNEDLANKIDYTCYEPITDPQLSEYEEEIIY